MDYNFPFGLFLIWLCLFQLCYKSTQANDVSGCGGFVVSPVNINYAPIEIKLYTGRGMLKYSTDCAPNNGYYFIPLYDNGDYVLRIEPPKGWSFDPMQVDFRFDGQNDICSKQTDINFVFKGFTIYGKVFSAYTSSGPRGVQVSLFSHSTNNIIKRTETTEGGLFSFSEVLLGNYTIEASHERWHFEQNKIAINVVNDNVNLRQLQENGNDQIRISGYTVKGRVTSDGQPIKGVHFALFTESDISVQQSFCDTSKPSFSGLSSVSGRYLCQAVSNSEGIFTFETLPVGKYILQIFYESGKSRFEVNPAKFEFELRHGDLEIEQLFQIGGFTISGSLVNKFNEHDHIESATVTLIDQNSKNEPVQVILDSSSKSHFTLNSIKTSTYTIKADAPHYQFEDTVVIISPNSPNLPVISPSKFELSGRINFRNDDSKFKHIKAHVMDKTANILIESMDIDNEEFRTFLNPGEYVLKIISSHSELRFTPESIKLKLDKPMLGLLFEQFTATVSGIIELTSDSQMAEGQLSLTLSRSDVILQTLTTTDLKPLTENRSQFTFFNVLPGEYEISLTGELANIFIWDSDVARFVIKDTDVENIMFKQQEPLPVSTSPDVDLEAFNLSTVSVQLVDQSGQPLHDVLVSLSGGEKNYRKNSVTNMDGKLEFGNLQPGEYFIRFMRKEFEFEPTSKMFSLTNDDMLNLQVVGKKVAFSCIGVVDSLNHDPEPGVVVEAVGIRNLVQNSSINCLQMQEEAITESDGSYRILGLHPQCQYAIQLKLDDTDHIRDSNPSVYSVRVEDRDITDKRFIVFHKQFLVDLSLYVKTESQYLSTLKVQLYRQDEPHLALFRHSFSASPFVFFSSYRLDNASYTIRIDSNLSPVTYQYTPIVHTFVANQSNMHFYFAFTPKPRYSHSSFTGGHEHDISSNSFYLLSFLLFGLLFYYNKQILNFVKNLSQHRDQFFSKLSSNHQSSNTDGAGSNTKKKLKTKKIN